MRRTLLLLGVLPLWRYANYRIFGMGHYNFARPDLNYDGLLIGAMLALLRSDSVGNALVEKVAPRSGVTALAVVLVVVLLQWAFALQMPKYGSVGLTASLILIALLIQSLTMQTAGWVGRALAFAPVEAVGRISYSLYLWQQVFFTREVESRFAQLPIAIFVAILAATASYYLVEKPMLRIRSRFEP